jgi:hypothetical protein
MRRLGLATSSASTSGVTKMSCLLPLSSDGEVERLATNVGVCGIVLPEMVVARDRGLRSRRGDGSRVNDLEFGNRGRPLAMLSPDVVAVGDDMAQVTERE